MDAGKCVLVFIALLANVARAHDPGLSSLTVDLTSKDVLVQVIYATADLGGAPASEQRAAASVVLETGGAAIAPRQVEARLTGTDVEFTLRFPHPRTASTLRSTLLAEVPFGHRQAATVRGVSGSTVLTEVLSAGQDSVLLPAGTNLVDFESQRRTARRAIVCGSAAAVVAAVFVVRWRHRRRSDSVTRA